MVYDDFVISILYTDVVICIAKTHLRNNLFQNDCESCLCIRLFQTKPQLQQIRGLLKHHFTADLTKYGYQHSLLKKPICFTYTCHFLSAIVLLPNKIKKNIMNKETLFMLSLVTL